MVRLFLGGSSGLACSYYHLISDEERSEWIWMGRRTSVPDWLETGIYWGCDLTSQDLLSELEGLRRLIPDGSKIECVLVSIRPPLLGHRSNQQARGFNERLASGIRELLRWLVQGCTVERIIHVSSIAAVGHLQAQIHHSVNDLSDPVSSQLNQPYDFFKKRTEEWITQLASENKISFTHLRLGAIFADSPRCIQCGAMSLQILGPYLSTRIDCNSARNVSELLRLMQQIPSLRPVYYYTRPLRQYPEPVPYGEYLMSYRRAYKVQVPLLVRAWMVHYFVVVPVHWLACVIALPYLHSLDYLLQVTVEEHTFDNSETATDFPRLIQVEESIAGCFARRRSILHSAMISSKPK